MHRFAFIITPIHTTLFYQLHKIKKKKKRITDPVAVWFDIVSVLDFSIR